MSQPQNAAVFVIQKGYGEHISFYTQPMISTAYAQNNYAGPGPNFPTQSNFAPPNQMYGQQASSLPYHGMNQNGTNQNGMSQNGMNFAPPNQMYGQQASSLPYHGMNQNGTNQNGMSQNGMSQNGMVAVYSAPGNSQSAPIGYLYQPPIFSVPSQTGPNGASAPYVSNVQNPNDGNQSSGNQKSNANVLPTSPAPPYSIKSSNDP
jgi:hypothetical protein